MKKITTTLSALLLSFVFLHAQNISTVAGNGTASYTGDNGQATAATLHTPETVVFDAAGNYYIADEQNNAIRKVSTSGVITTVAGTGAQNYTGDHGQATAATLYWPIGVAVDGSGNIYFSEVGNNTIRKVDASGIITTIVGNGSAGYSGDNGPGTAAQLHAPRFIALDAGNNNLYIADQYNNRIRKLNLSSGIITTVAGNGTGAYNGDNGQATAAELQLPYGVALDASGNLYIADQANNRIRKVDGSGIITTIVGTGTASFNGDGNAATATTINNPAGVNVGPGGDLMFSDLSNERIRIVSQWNGNVYTIAGNGTAGYNGDGGAATAAEIYFPNGISSDAHGNLFIGDWQNNAIREITNADVASVINLQGDASVNAYPNPANDRLFVSLPKSTGKMQVTLFNIVGQEEYKQTVSNEEKLVVDVNTFATGLYILRVQTEQGQFLTKKVEIIH